MVYLSLLFFIFMFVSLFLNGCQVLMLSFVGEYFWSKAFLVWIHTLSLILLTRCYHQLSRRHKLVCLHLTLYASAFLFSETNVLLINIGDRQLQCVLLFYAIACPDLIEPLGVFISSTTIYTPVVFLDPPFFIRLWFQMSHNTNCLAGNRSHLLFLFLVFQLGNFWQPCKTQKPFTRARFVCSALL